VARTSECRTRRTWIAKRNESTREGWAPYARERRRIADHIVRLGLTRRLVMLSGDAHMLALDDGTHMRGSLEVPGMRLELVV
jgi:phosphodiesterase/alkaline phosphatase D-like protein